MQLVFEDKKKGQIKNQKKIKFSSFSSYHLIVITARAKSEKQLGKSATDDEDLTVKIEEDKTFPKLNSNRLIDSPAAFSGGRLHNLAKTVYFLTFLTGKDHIVTLETDKPPSSATFESIQVYVLNPTKKLTLKTNIQAEDGDRRPWLTFVLDNLPLQEINATITYSRRKRDSDDVKIKIDGKTQGNIVRNIKHFLWRFVGSFLPWSSPTKTETQKFDIDLSEGLHYVELDADRMPTLEELILNFGDELRLPKDLPSVDNPKWTDSFYDDTEVMLLARAIYGEAGGESEEAKIGVGWAIRNRVKDSKERWGDTYHEVILKPFQYEPFNDPNSDAFKKITNPPLENPLEKNAWEESYKAAAAIILNRTPDPTSGANHFYSTRSPIKPSWVIKDKFIIQIGTTRFYKL